nr:phospho-sugar mutase [Bacillota bacterium]
MTEIDLEQRYQEWLNSESLDPDMRRELEKMEGDPAAKRSCFGAELQFGTGGMRGIIGPGLNRMNLYVVRRATQGLADYLNKTVKEAAARKVAIAYDTRRFSREFALEAALVLAANGVKAYLFDGERPTPQLSFTIRALGCAAGIVVTASHNPPQYNGYKVYGPDGGQAVSPLVDELSESIRAVHIFRDVKCISREEALAKGLLEMIG